VADPADFSSQLNPDLKYDDSSKELLPIRAQAINPNDESDAPQTPSADEQG
jgi:hypothetical protein